jgi:RNA polymerase sigma factor (TIGR02999 family)
MSTDRPTDLTRLLDDVHAGKTGAVDELSNAVYDQLRAMARRHLNREGAGDLAGLTIQPTILASDTLMKLIRQRQQYDNTGHFFAIASRLMMRVLLDYHRARTAAKRGGGAVHVSLDAEHHDQPGAAPASPASGDVDVEALDGALERLAKLDARKADVVRYRVLWGLTVSQISDALGIAVATVERDWAFAKTWLAKELSSSRN